MKNIALIVFGVIVVTIVAMVVLIATLPTAKVTIQSIRPTGGFVTRNNMFKEAVTGEEWLFGITNVGRATATWNTFVHSRRSNPSEDITSLIIAAQSHGVLKPGEGLVTNMIVPTGDTTEWSGCVNYATIPTSFQQRLWHLGFKTPGMEKLLLQRNAYKYSETSWHPVTNAPMASSTVTNAP